MTERADIAIVEEEVGQMADSAQFEVELEGTATKSDVALVEAVFDEFGVRPKIRASYGIGGDLPDLAIWIIVFLSARGFLEAFGAENAKKIVEKLWSQRSQTSPGSNGIILLNEYGSEPDPLFSATVVPDLPEAAFDDLRVLASTLRRGKVMYDSSLNGWIVDDRQLRGEIKYLYDNFVLSSASPRRSRWKFWRR